MLLTKLLEWLRKSFANDHQSELETYLASKPITSSGDVDYWIAEYDNRRRMISRCIANGDGAGAAHLRQWY
jgi:hypothetical protein